MRRDHDRLSPQMFRKLAWRTLPLLGVGYLFAYMDRVNIGFAAAQMNAQMGFDSAVFGLGGGLFFLSYAILEVPSNLMMQRMGARLWIGRIMLTWGVLAAATILVKTPWQFYAMRLLLGAAEAGFFPAVVVYLSRWFPLESRSRALSLFYVGFPLSSVVMGAMAGSLLGLDGTLHLRGWQWLLLVEGLPAAVLSLAIFAWLPERLSQVSWLSDAEKADLQARLATPPVAEEPKGLAPILRILADPTVLRLGLVNALFLGTSYAFILTSPQVLGLRTGMDVASVGYLVSVGGLIGAVAMLGNGWLADRNREHFLHLAVPLMLMAGAYLLLALTHNPLLATAAFLLSIVGANGFNAVFMVLVSRLVRPRDLIVGAAAVNMIGQFGSFLLPIAYGDAQKVTGRLDAPLIALPVSFVAATVIVLALRASSSKTDAMALAAEA